MTTMTCHHCRKPVKRYDAALRSISLELAAFHPACLTAHFSAQTVGAAVDEVFADPSVIVAGHVRGAA